MGRFLVPSAAESRDRRSLTKRKEVAGLRTGVVFDHVHNTVVTPPRARGRSGHRRAT
jgi:hypothetical protein